MPRSRKPASPRRGAEPILPSVNPASSRTRRGAERPTLIVGVGASAGGLQALSDLLGELHEDSPFALVVVQHLDPVRQSALATILAKRSRLPVLTAEHKQVIEPGHAYVIPPGRDMILGDGLLQLSPRTEHRGEHRPVDKFLRSLAEEQSHRAIAVILSGTGSDGTLGVEEIKAAGGITFAQDKSAEFTAMPRHAIASGSVDFVLPPAEIARELLRISGHSWMGRAADESGEGDPAVHSVLESIRSVTGVDFSQYKRNTLARRIARRMVVHKHDTLQGYAAMLKKDPAEVEALYHDILINVTSFFRNPEAYECLKEKVFPALTDTRSRHQPVRVWTLGCSTGEEAYSIAMTYMEYAEAAGRRVPMQIFATDLNASGIEKARSGMYSRGIEQDVSPERLRRFFVEVDGSYRVAKPIRDMCVFARQNVLADPPFSRLDVIACRNVLIYLDSPLQRKLLPVLHYALRPGGFLWLGQSETIGSYRDLFDAEDARHKLYRRKDGPRTVPAPISLARAPLSASQLRAGAPGAEPRPGKADLHDEADRIVLSRFGPPGVVINAQFDILQFRGDTGRYLSPAPGRASYNLLKMLRDGLSASVRAVIKKAQRDKAAARIDNARVHTGGAWRDIAVSATPLREPGSDTLFLVLFEEVAAAAPAVPPPAPPPAGAAAQREVQRLTRELAANREYLQSVIEQQEAVNEELQSANEEVQSANEELQSINEELETSKEEIQSSNEELATVNDELQDRNAELSAINNDLTNLLGSSQMAIVMMGRDLKIRRYTPAAEKLLNLIPTDLGRPFSDIKPRFDAPDLATELRDVIDSVTVREREIQDFSGRWYLLRLRPYRTLESKIDGAVLMLLDIDTIKRAEQAARESEARYRALADTTPALIWIAGPQGFEFVNRSMLEFTGAAEPQMTGFEWLQFVHPDDRESCRAAFRAAIAARGAYEWQYRLRHRDGAYRDVRSRAVPRGGPASPGFAGVTIDLSPLRPDAAAGTP